LIESCAASLVYSDHGREVFACRAISIDVRDGEFLGILGPSGSGKSSLLYLLSGLKQPSSGCIRYRGQDLASLSDEERSNMRLREFGFVFQQAFLLGYLSALENVLAANPTNGNIATLQNPNTVTPDSAAALLATLGLGEKLHRRPHELSGGERQRVCVARALFGSPNAIFADEPTASLDHKNGEAVVRLLNQHRGKGSLIMVTHDETMLDEADRIVRLVDGQIV